MTQRTKLPLFRTFSKADDETVSAFDVVTKVVNVVLSAISEYDEKFSFFPVSKSSFLIVKGSTHFEIMVILKHLSTVHLELDEKDSPPGLTLVHFSQDTTLPQWRNLCGQTVNGKESLSAKRVCSSFSTLITSLIDDVENFRSRKGLTQDISISNISTEEVVAINIKLGSSSYMVELVPAVECCGVWPVCAYKWRENTAASWPNQQTKNETVSGGIHLVAKQANDEFHWRIWFCKAERTLLEFTKMPSKRRCLTLLKKIMFGELQCSCLSSYHIQTVLLHECVKFPVDTEWDDRNIFERLVSILQSLENSLRAKKCPHFFMPALNLFSGIPGVTLELVAEKIREILQDPSNLREKLLVRQNSDKAFPQKVKRSDSSEDTWF